MATITLHDVSKSYPLAHHQTTEVLHHLSLEIPDHSFFTFLGESGSGKTTLLKVISGIEVYDSGTIQFNGVEASNLSLREKNMAMVSQNYALYPHCSVYENVLLGLYPLHLSESEMKNRVEEVAKICQMEPYLTRRPGQLSGGQQQRAAIMRAIARKADVVMMDEPLSNVESSFREEVIQNLLRIKNECHATYLYATHDLSEAMRLSDRIALLKEGSLLQCDEPKAFYERPNNLDVFRFMNPGRALVLPRRLFEKKTKSLPQEVAFLGVATDDCHLDEKKGFLQGIIQKIAFNEEGHYSLSLLVERSLEVAFPVVTSIASPGEECFLSWDETKELYFDQNGRLSAKGK